MGRLRLYPIYFQLLIFTVLFSSLLLGIEPQFPDIFIQQEHEGKQIGSNKDIIDPSGDIFTYYTVEKIVPSLIEETVMEMGLFDRIIYKAYKQIYKNPWEAFSTQSKVIYLRKLERHLREKEGGFSYWSGSTCRLLTRRKDAPPYVDLHPRMEVFPGEPDENRRQFKFSEIVTSKDTPAFTIDQVINRASRIIADTGHDSMHFHVFLKIAYSDLEKQIPSIQKVLQILNDELFLESVISNTANIDQINLSFWHQGRSLLVRKIIQEGSSEAHIPDFDNPNNEKGVYLAFRYWGIENGLAVISFELRGVTAPRILPPSDTFHARAVDEAERLNQIKESYSKRDFSQVRTKLTLLTRMVESIKKGTLADSIAYDRELSLELAEKTINQYAIIKNNFFTSR